MAPTWRRHLATGESCGIPSQPSAMALRPAPAERGDGNEPAASPVESGWAPRLSQAPSSQGPATTLPSWRRAFLLRLACHKGTGDCQNIGRGCFCLSKNSACALSLDMVERSCSWGKKDTRTLPRSLLGPACARAASAPGSSSWQRSGAARSSLW